MKELDSAVIVYAEDDVNVRSAIARYLLRRVKAVEEANNGEEGLTLIREYNPDVVITDLEMPVMGGLEMIKRIREEYGENKPIIIITGYNDREHYTEDADAILYKPIDLGLLMDTIKELLG
jgi:YesN/AraC family two-component response regulator